MMSCDYCDGSLDMLDFDEQSDDHTVERYECVMCGRLGHIDLYRDRQTQYYGTCANPFQQ